MFSELSPALLHTLYLVAIVAEAMTAALSAGRRDMDWMGVCIIACVTALGGGSLRDVLLGHYPLTWVVHPEYLWMTGGAAILTALIAPVMRRLRSVFLLADALGLVAFTVIGCQVAQMMQLPVTVVLISGMITGCAGGVLRDVLCGEIPQAFRDHQPYAVCAFAGGCADLLLRQFDAVHETAPLLACVVVTAGLRALAMWRQWRIPSWRMED